MTTVSRRQFNLGATIAALFGPGIAGKSLAAKTAVAGGTVRISVASEPPILIDVLQNTGSASVGGKVIEGLVRVNFDLSVSPFLAKSWEVSPDGRTYTFQLQEGVKWHDGTPFTSEDVAFSLFTLREVHPRRRSTFANLESADTSDPHRIVLQFSKPAPYLLPALSAGASPIIPKHLYEGTDVKTSPWNSKPVGTGPYIFREWERGSHFALDRNPDYWVKDQPLLDEIIVRFIPDPSARVAALEAGEIDFAAGSQIPLQEVTRLRENPVFGSDTRGYETGGAMNQFFFNLRHEALAKLPVRQAFAHAIDVPDYIAKVYRGFAEPCASAIVPALKEFHDASIKHHSFDPALSEKLLDEAGYLCDADGTRLVLRLTYNPAGGGTMKTAAEYLRSALGVIGVVADLQPYDFATYVKKVYTDAAFDLDIQTLANGYDPTDGIQRGYWSKAISPGLAWSNHSYYSNPEVDEIFEKGAGEADPAKRREYYVRLQHILYRDLPAVNLVAQQNITIFSTRLHDHTLESNIAHVPFTQAWLEA